MSLVYASVYAQTGLECVEVERYYVSNSSDTALNATGGRLPVGSVTYRIYADMLPGYTFQAVYGVDVAPSGVIGSGDHELRIETSTLFFNNEDRGDITPSYTKSRCSDNTVMLDSWLSAGAACVGNFGIPKSADNAVANVVNADGILQNNDASAGIPLTQRDGIIAVTGRTPTAVTLVGLTGSQFNNQNDGTNGPLLSTYNGSWACLGGCTGPDSLSNKVLIAQITTDGIFSFELNVQIGTPQGGIERYVARNPVGNEIFLPCLSDTFGLPVVPAAPVVSITNRNDGDTVTTGALVDVAIQATSNYSTISSTELYVNGVAVGSDNSAPYQVNWTPATDGWYSVYAKASDAMGLNGYSDTLQIYARTSTVLLPPTVILTNPADGDSAFSGTVLNISATAAAPSALVSKVEFFVDGTLAGTDVSIPYSITWNVQLGVHQIYAMVTDTSGLTGFSDTISFTGRTPLLAPTVTLVSPTQGAVFVAANPIQFAATATAPSGTVSSVEFFLNNVSFNTDNSFPYSTTWNSVAGTHTVYAKVTDSNNQMGYSDTVTITVNSTVSIENIPSDAGVVVYPSPATDRVFVKSASNGVEFQALQVYNQLGVLVYHSRQAILPGKVISFDVSDWPAGVYIIRITDTKDRFVSRSFLK